MISRKIPELPGVGRLGRHVAHDERSWDYPAERAGTVQSVVHQAVGLPLDQGQIGSCTANAECGANNAKPNQKFHFGPFTEKGARNLYHAETVAEGQPWPPNDPGGTGLAVCQAAQKFGWIQSYSHAFGLQHALEALTLRPVIIGVNWYDSFDQPDSNGLVEIGPGAQVRGGHEIVVLRIIAEHEQIGLVNSWGTAYGVPDADIGVRGGAFYMSFATFEQLLNEQGDVTVPVQ